MKKSAKRQSNIQFAFVLILIAVFIVVFLFPFYMALATSFKTKLEIAENVFAPPKGFNVQNYLDAMERSNFWRALLNTCITTFPSVAALVVLASLGGYAIARFGSKRRIIRWMDKVYLAALMIPFQILMIPIYKLFKSLGLQNNLWGMLIMLTGNSMAYSTFLYVGFVKGVPVELEEAALVDGCGTFKAFFRVVFPMLQPVTATVAALHIMWHWNDFNIALVLLQKDEVRTLTVKQFYFFSEHSSEYPMAFAAAILSMLPVMLFFLLMQKYIVSGISAGAVKS